MRGHTHLLIRTIGERGFKVIAEIGVAKGKNMREILGRSPSADVITEYWAVDPWWESPKYAISGDALCILIYEFMLQFPPLKLIRLPSPEAAAIFPDGYFDLVYIDAYHYYEAVCMDITAWLPKVRPGGLLAGHDYNQEPVRKAVNDLLPSAYAPAPPPENHKVWFSEVPDG